MAKSKKVETKKAEVKKAVSTKVVPTKPASLFIVEKGVAFAGTYARKPMVLKGKKERPVKQKASKYPFAEMEVGDSFVVKDRYVVRCVLTSAKAYAKLRNIDIVYASRVLTDETYRIWRIK